MTTEELDDLKRKAEAADSGPWRIHPDANAVSREGLPYTVADCGWPTDGMFPGKAKANAAHVAAASPDAVLRMIAYIEGLERALHDLQQDKGAVVDAARRLGREEVAKHVVGKGLHSLVWKVNHVPEGETREDRAATWLEDLPSKLPPLSPVPSIMELREEVRRLKEELASRPQPITDDRVQEVARQMREDALRRIRALRTPFTPHETA